MDHRRSCFQILGNNNSSSQERNLIVSFPKEWCFINMISKKGRNIISSTQLFPQLPYSAIVCVDSTDLIYRFTSLRHCLYPKECFHSHCLSPSKMVPGNWPRNKGGKVERFACGISFRQWDQRDLKLTHNHRCQLPFRTLLNAGIELITWNSNFLLLMWLFLNWHWKNFRSIVKYKE